MRVLPTNWKIHRKLDRGGRWRRQKWQTSRSGIVRPHPPRARYWSHRRCIARIRTVALSACVAPPQCARALLWFSALWTYPRETCTDADRVRTCSYTDALCGFSRRRSHFFWAARWASLRHSLSMGVVLAALMAQKSFCCARGTQDRQMAAT